MGAPFWSEEERTYFVDVILPMSKYAGGNYSNPRGIDFGELATIMQSELDRSGISRRQYTGDMLFQHYYQKCSNRSYKRGEGDHVAGGNSMARTSAGNMSPPPRPTSTRRPSSKRSSMNITYGHVYTQANVTVEAGSKSELALQDYHRYSGPPVALYETIAANSNLDVQPVATSTNKRKYQATVEDTNEDYIDFFSLRDERPETAMQPVMRKKTTRLRANAGENETKAGDGIFNSMYEISKPLNMQPSEPERHRTPKLQNPWAQSFVPRPQTPLGGARGFASPRSETHSEGTSSIAYKTYTPSLSLDRPSLASDTSHPLRHRRSLAKSLLEGSSHAPSRASERGESGLCAYQAVRSPLREPSRNSNMAGLDIRVTSPIVRSSGIGPSRAAYREDSHNSDFIRSPQRESSRAASFREESRTFRIPRSPPSMSLANGSSRYDQDDNWYPGERRVSPFGYSRYKGLGSRKQESKGDKSTRPSVPESFRFSPSLEQRIDDNPTATPITSGRTPLPSFRKRTKQQPPTSSPSSAERQCTN